MTFKIKNPYPTNNSALLQTEGGMGGPDTGNIALVEGARAAAEGENTGELEVGSKDDPARADANACAKNGGTWDDVKQECIMPTQT